DPCTRLLGARPVVAVERHAEVLPELSAPAATCHGEAMKAAVVPAVKSRWEVKEVPTSDPGPNQVLIAIRASGLCFTDVHQTNGELPGPFPRILGHEPVGEIVTIGTGVRTRRVGDRIGVPWLQASCGRCEWCLRGRPMFWADQIDPGLLAGG